MRCRTLLGLAEALRRASIRASAFGFSFQIHSDTPPPPIPRIGAANSPGEDRNRSIAAIRLDLPDPLAPIRTLSVS